MDVDINKIRDKKYKDNRPTATVFMGIFMGLDMNHVGGVFATTSSDPKKAKIIPIKSVYSVQRYNYTEKQFDMMLSELKNSTNEWGKFAPDPEEYNPEENIILTKEELRYIITEWFLKNDIDIDIDSLLSEFR